MASKASTFFLYGESPFSEGGKAFGQSCLRYKYIGSTYLSDNKLRKQMVVTEANYKKCQYAV